MPDARKSRRRLILCLEVAMYQSPESRKAERFHRKTAASHVSVHFSHLRLSLTLPIGTFRVIKKNKKSSWLYFYTSGWLMFFSAKGHPKRLQLTREGLLVKLANHYTTRSAHIWLFSNLLSFFCFDVEQGCMNGAPNETRTHSWNFASLAC